MTALRAGYCLVVRYEPTLGYRRMTFEVAPAFGSARPAIPTWMTGIIAVFSPQSPVPQHLSASSGMGRYLLLDPRLKEIPQFGSSLLRKRCNCALEGNSIFFRDAFSSCLLHGHVSANWTVDIIEPGWQDDLGIDGADAVFGIVGQAIVPPGFGK